MKLLLCRECGDVFKLSSKRVKKCNCGKTRGRYLEDGLNAWYEGEFAVPLGIANNSLTEAVAWQPEDGMGSSFVAFVVPKKCDTFVKKNNLDSCEKLIQDINNSDSSDYNKSRI